MIIGIQKQQQQQQQTQNANCKNSVLLTYNGGRLSQLDHSPASCKKKDDSCSFNCHQSEMVEKVEDRFFNETVSTEREHLKTDVFVSKALKTGSSLGLESSLTENNISNENLYQKMGRQLGSLKQTLLASNKSAEGQDPCKYSAEGQVLAKQNLLRRYTSEGCDEMASLKEKAMDKTKTAKTGDSTITRTPPQDVTPSSQIYDRSIEDNRLQPNNVDSLNNSERSRKVDLVQLQPTNMESLNNSERRRTVDLGEDSVDLGEDSFDLGEDIKKTNLEDHKRNITRIQEIAMNEKPKKRVTTKRRKPVPLPRKESFPGTPKNTE